MFIFIIPVHFHCSRAFSLFS